MTTIEEKEAFKNSVNAFVKQYRINKDIISDEKLVRLAEVVVDATSICSRFFEKSGYRKNSDNFTITTKIKYLREIFCVTITLDEYVNSVRETYTSESYYLLTTNLAYAVESTAAKLITENKLDVLFEVEDLIEDEPYLLSEYEDINRCAYTYLLENGHLDDFTREDILNVISNMTEQIAIIRD